MPPVIDYRSAADDPDSYRMTIGEHLEELRRRVIRGLLGFVAAAAVCMLLGTHVVRFFCRPLVDALANNHLNPQIYFQGVEETFIVYMKVSLITAGAISAPWVLYQLWQFVAAGLYPQERKYITKYIPLSITLLILGMVFLYTFVLPITLNFFLAFTIGFPLEFPDKPTTAPTAPTVMTVPSFSADPPKPAPLQIWYNQTQRRLKVYVDGQADVIPLGGSALVSPLITLDGYIAMVINLLLSFGIAFQMPLVVMALARVGIVDIPTLKKWRRYVYFSMSIVAAFIVPDVVTGMIALMLPLIGLYEFGIFLASWSERQRRREARSSGLEA